MYFPTYDAALQAAIKQSKAMLTDCKLYIKYVAVPNNLNYPDHCAYKIGFTPDSTRDAYVYNGEVKTIQASESQQGPAPSNKDSEMSFIGLSIQQSINENYK